MVKLEHARPRKIGLSEESLDRLGHVLQREAVDGRIPGAVALVARGGRIGYFEAFGRRAPGSEDAMAPDSIFRIYSMTKPVTGIAAMMLIEDGKLGLDQPLGEVPSEHGATDRGVIRRTGIHLVDRDQLGRQFIFESLRGFWHC